MKGIRTNRKSTRRVWIDRQMERIEHGDPSVSWQLWQQCPNTAVRVALQIPGIHEPLVGLGFAKMNWPDKWDIEEGQQIALHKAIASIWRHVMGAPIFDEGE